MLAVRAQAAEAGQFLPTDACVGRDPGEPVAVFVHGLPPPCPWARRSSRTENCQRWRDSGSSRRVTVCSAVRQVSASLSQSSQGAFWPNFPFNRSAVVSSHSVWFVPRNFLEKVKALPTLIEYESFGCFWGWLTYWATKGVRVALAGFN